MESQTENNNPTTPNQPRFSDRDVIESRFLVLVEDLAIFRRKV